MLQNDLCSVRAAELVHRAGTSWPPPEQGLWSPAGWHYPGGEPQGLYNPREQDSCGVSCVMDIDPEREASHETLELLLEAHECQEHRGACASDRRTGDGCGVNVWLPWSYFQTELADRGADVPEGTPIGVGMLFFPEEPHRVRALQQCAEAALREHFGEDVVYRWRVVSIESSKIGDHADRTRPAIYQLMVVRPDSCDGDEWHFEFKLFALKKYLEQQEVWIRNKAYICSFSCRQIVYKLLGTGGQLRAFYNDLRDPAFKIRGGIAHERFSTNTTSRWALAQPFSQMCHNG